MANPTADWEKVGDKFYRKIQLYTAVFDQDLELDNYIVAGSSYGGAIGMKFHSFWIAKGRGAWLSVSYLGLAGKKDTIPWSAAMRIASAFLGDNT
jgi:alpha-beta hydrolase superfamily lysophospholipase